MIINHNMGSMNANRMMAVNQANAGKSMQKLSSGLRINNAADDAAGLAISEKMRGQIRGLDQASANAQDGISLIQTTEGSLAETHSILQRMRELAVQGANDTNSTTDRGQIQKELTALTSEINRIGNTTEFNTMKLLNGEKSDQHVTGSSTSIATFIKGGAKSVATSTGITDGASSLDLAGKVTIAGSAGNGFDYTNMSGASAVNIIKIGKNTSGQLQVNINAESTLTSQTIATVDKVAPTWDTNNQFTFNSHGVSFTINKADFDNASDTTTKDIDLTKANGMAALTSGVQLDTSNDWASNALGAKISGGITIASAGMASGLASAAASIEIILASGAAGTSSVSSMTVRIKSASGAVLMSDVVASSVGSAVSYSNYGISFDISTAGGSQASATLSFSLDDYKTTSSLTTQTKKDDSLTFQVGANENQSMSVAISDMRSKALGLTSTTSGATGFTADKNVTDGTNNTSTEFSLDVSSAAASAKSVTTIEAAIEKVSDERSKLGAYQNRLEHTIANLGTSSENLQSAESRIRDVNMAKEMSTFSKNNILAQAAQAMLAQANQQPQQVLQLLR